MKVPNSTACFFLNCFFLIQSCVSIDNQYVMNTFAGGGSSDADEDVAATSAFLNAPKGVWSDSNGVIYIAVFGTNCVRKVDVSGIISTVAGVVSSTSFGTSVDGLPATSALLHGPNNVVVDTNGVVYINDMYNYMIKKVSVGGIMSTFAGNGLSGAVDGLAATSAALGELAGLWLDSLGRIYYSNYAQYDYDCVRTIGSDSIVTLYAGTSSGQTGDGFPATSTSFASIPFLTGDTTGALYFGDGDFHVRSVANGGARLVSTVMGNGVMGYSGEGTPATATALDLPYGVAIDTSGNVYVSLFDGKRVQMLSKSSGLVTTLAGTGDTPEGVEGGAATSGAVVSPCQLIVSSSGDVYVTDIFWGKVRLIQPSAVVSTVATPSAAPVVVASPSAAPVVVASPSVAPVVVASPSVAPVVVASPSAAPVVVASPSVAPVVVASPSVAPTASTYVMNSFAGGGSSDTDEDVAATSAFLNAPEGVWSDSNGVIYIAVFGTNCVRKVDVSGIISTVAGVVSSTSFGTSVDGLPATSALLHGPNNVVVDTNGVVYINDVYNYRIKKVSVGGIMSTFAGNGLSGAVDGLAATSAALGELAGLWLDSLGRIYYSNYAQYGYDCVRTIGSDNIVTLYAGTSSGQTGDGFPATSTSFASIPYLTGDTTGALYFGDGDFHVRSVANGGARLVSTVMGNGVMGYSGEGTPATATALDLPYGVAIDTSGNVYVSLFDGKRVQMLSKSSGLVTTLAGTGDTPEGVEEGAATSGAVVSPCQLIVSSSGSVYVTDIFWGKVKLIQPTAVVSTVATPSAAPSTASGEVTSSDSSSTSTHSSGLGLSAIIGIVAAILLLLMAAAIAYLILKLRSRISNATSTEQTGQELPYAFVKVHQSGASSNVVEAVAVPLTGKKGAPEAEFVPFNDEV